MKKYFKFSLGLVALAIVAVTILVGCKKNEQAIPNPNNDTKIVRFGTGLMAVDYAPFYVAKKLGFFDEVLKQKGYTASYTIFQGPAPANEAMAGNSVDVVYIAEPPVIVGKAAGINIKIAGISCVLVQEILVRSNSNIHSVADLKGKKIAVMVGSSSHYGVAKMLEKAGLTLNDAQIINMAPPDARAAFDAGSVDAWAVWPPWVEQEELAGTGIVLPQQGQVINSLLTLRGGFVVDHPDLTAIIQAVHEKAKKWIIENPNEAQKIVADALNVPLEVIKKAWPEHNWSATLSDNVLNDLQNKADFLKQQNLINNPVNVRESMLLQPAH